MTQDDSLRALTDEIRTFSVARNWEQFHRPRSLVLALAGEVGELATELQWVPDADVDEHLAGGDGRDTFEAELADVVIYALRPADVTGVDLTAAVRRKLLNKADRYPVGLSRGTSLKYDQLPKDGGAEAGESRECRTS